MHLKLKCNVNRKKGLIAVLFVMACALLLYLPLERTVKLFIMATVMIIYLGAEYHQIEIRLEICAFFLILLCGLVYSGLNEPFSIADERGHFNSEYVLANKVLGIKTEDTKEHVDTKGFTYTKTAVREIDMILQEDFDFSYKKLIKSNTGYKEIELPRFQYPAIPGYTPGILAIIIGRSISLSAFGLILLVRLLNLFAYAVVAYYSLKKVPVAKELIFVCFLAPLSVQQAASCSYDGLLYAMAFAYICYILYLAYGSELLDKKKLSFLLIFSMLFVIMKSVYVLFVLMILLIPQCKFKTEWRVKRGCLLGIIAVSAMWWLFFNMMQFDISDIISSDIKSRYVNYSNSEGMYLSTIVHNPIYVITFISYGIFYEGMSLFTSMTYNTYHVGNLVSLCYLLLFAYSCVPEKKEVEGLDNIKKLFILGILIGSYAILCILTNISYGGIEREAPQLSPRYVVPFLPLIGLLLRFNCITATVSRRDLIVKSELILFWLIFFLNTIRLY